MFDFGWSEMLVIGVVALIVVGPKDLPKMFHTLGEVTGKARGMAREFQRAMDAAARESGVGDVVKDIRRTTSTQGLKEATGLDEIEKEFRAIGHGLDGKPASPARPAATDKSGPELPPQPVPAEDLAEAEDDEIAAQDLARRNAEMSATEAQRLKRRQQTEAARQKAAQLRALREPEPQTPPQQTPPQQPDRDS